MLWGLGAHEAVSPLLGILGVSCMLALSASVLLASVLFGFVVGFRVVGWRFVGLGFCALLLLREELSCLLECM